MCRQDGGVILRARISSHRYSSVWKCAGRMGGGGGGVILRARISSHCYSSVWKCVICRTTKLHKTDFSKEKTVGMENSFQNLFYRLPQGVKQNLRHLWGF